MMTLEERLDNAEKKIQDPDFRQNKGLGNVLGYYVFDYPAESELYVRERIEYIQRKNANSSDDYKVCVFDLYDIVIGILEHKGFLEKCYDFERKRGIDRITKSIGSMLRITSTDNLIARHIKENIPEKAIVFLTGIGKCYPILRSHMVLNNLPQVVDSVPVILFYPGNYTGQELILFNEIKDGNYYLPLKLVE